MGLDVSYHGRSTHDQDEAINKEYFDYVKNKLNTNKSQQELFAPTYQLSFQTGNKNL